MTERFPSAAFRTFHEHMFPPPSTALRSAACHVLELAIDFATLGAYQLDHAAEEPAPAGRPAAAGPAFAAGSATRAERRRVDTSLIRPATAAGRSRAKVVAEASATAPSPSRCPGLAQAGRARRQPRTRRARQGAPRPAPQPCLTAEAGSRTA